MKNFLIELTDSDDQKFLINVMHIVWIEPAKGGTSIRMEEYSFPKKVKESFDEIKALIRALDS
ncbi:MAG: hypothetical protein NT092_05555 [Bacteroidia bacterium]|nr:hypothetical protein [Bacteroidia bacterium]